MSGGGGSDDNPTRQRRRPPQALSVDAGAVASPPRATTTTSVHVGTRPRRRRRRRRQSSIDPTDDSSKFYFGCLVVRVATSLAVCCLAAGYVYIRLYPRQTDNDTLYNNSHDTDDTVDATLRLTSIDDTAAAAGYELPAAPRSDHHHHNNDNNDNPSTIQSPWVATEPTRPPFPVWNLSDFAQHNDAYAIAQRYDPRHWQNNNTHTHNKPPASTALFWQIAAGLRQTFADTYAGGHDATARGILDRATTSLVPDDHHPTHTRDTTDASSSVRDTACRMLHAHRDERPLYIAFGGYSVTAGRGNYFHQSFPLVMKEQLKTAFAALDMEVSVRNAAMGGCASFPYGWCLPNFWNGRPQSPRRQDQSTAEEAPQTPVQPDVVSWDFSMNEAGGDPTGLEAYLRRVMQLPRPPKLIVKDTHLAVERKALLQYYADHNHHNVSHNHAVSTARDLLIVHTDPAARPFLDMVEDHRPIGFQAWRVFGAPPNAPGQSLHHPAVKEHAFIAWLLTLHFLSALQLVAASRDEVQDVAFFEPGKGGGGGGNSTLMDYCESSSSDQSTPKPSGGRGWLPEPLHANRRLNHDTDPWTSLLFGEPADLNSKSSSSSSTGSSEASWTMNPVHCRTSFEPATSGNLSDIVVGGAVGEAMDVMLPKSKMFYNQGWVLDLSEGEKKAKRSLQRFGGLGYIDSKKAYYGIFASKTLRFLLPVANDSVLESGQRATIAFQSIVVCEVNEKRGPAACNSEVDVLYTVGGVNATPFATRMNAAGTLYLGKKLCTHIVVPNEAVLTTERAAAQENGNAPESSSIVGLELTATVHNRHINGRDEACSISHVVWEQASIQ